MNFALLSKQVKTGRIMSWEKYTKNIKDPMLCARDIMKYFNSTLRAGESPRKLIAVCVLDKDLKNYDHKFIKTNLITVNKGRRFFDEYRCENCGVTGKRYGLEPNVIIDNKYKAKKYYDCKWYYQVKK